MKILLLFAFFSLLGCECPKNSMCEEMKTTAKCINGKVHQCNGEICVTEDRFNECVSEKDLPRVECAVKITDRRTCKEFGGSYHHYGTSDFPDTCELTIKRPLVPEE